MTPHGFGQTQGATGPLFVAAKQLTQSAGHPFNQKLNQLLDDDRVDALLQEDSTC
jgi:hypothetical protein